MIERINTTYGKLNAGDIFYLDGSHIIRVRTDDGHMLLTGNRVGKFYNSPIYNENLSVILLKNAAEALKTVAFPQ